MDLHLAAYGWLTFMSGIQIVAGLRTAENTNAFEMFAHSQSLILLMAYAEARDHQRHYPDVDHLVLREACDDRQIPNGT